MTLDELSAQVAELSETVAAQAGGLFIAGSNAATTVNFTGNLSGSVGSVTGAVGSVTGAVGSVTGAVGSVTGAVGSVTGNVGGNVVGSVASVVGAVGSVTGLTAANLDVAVSTRSTYAGADTAGTTTLLSRLSAGRATNLDNLDAAVTTRLASASYTAPDNATISAIAGYVDTEIASIKGVIDKLDTAMELDGAVYRFTTNALEQSPAGGGGGGLDAAGVRAAIGLAAPNLDTQLSDISTKTANLPSDPADASDIATAFGTVNTTLGTLATAANLATVDTVVDAIQAKTDQLAFTGGNVAANVKAVNSLAVSGAGTEADPWGP
jgi:hypothetical protein